jgi:hypothetical protein
MHSVAVVCAWNENAPLAQTLESLRQCEMIRAQAALVPHGISLPPVLSADSSNVTPLSVTSLWSKPAILDTLKWFTGCGADYMLLVTGPGAPVFNPDGLRRMVSCMADTRASLVYGDYYDIQQDGGVRMHPLIDYQPGSIRDSFNFGSAVLINGLFVESVQSAIGKTTPDLVYGGLYDLRLRLVEHAPVYHLPEPFYCCILENKSSQDSSHFAYVDPRNREYQIEMEKIATAYLQRIGAFITTPAERSLADTGKFPVKASVIIPVRNRLRTIGDAVRSALSQETTFDYNVIVVDNHSTDGTTDILARIAKDDCRLIHRIPQRTDLLIGGCWNEAIYSDQCGMYAVQLDSDDLYSGTDVLERIIAEFNRKPYALVIGAYTTVNFDLETLAPGLIDHREWTDSNGQNNALRIAGLGAPRSYHVATLRQSGFPNVSYGEDYAVVLRLCRSYQVGRIYDSLYWCRRWEDNTDSALAPETANRYDLYKDRLRTVELAARIRREDCR